ncbi:MAG: glycerophosphodiester phosphodiesterase [bacterium]|nr:glycerophosphodiester phosphodiesterase [bacterium]
MTEPCPYLSHEHPIRLAHRGSTLLWPENTMTAFQGAVDLGFQYIETDVHSTRDGVLVTFHDHLLDRTTNGSGPIADMLWDDLRKLDAAYFFNPDAGYPLRNRGVRIPSLEEVLTTFPKVKFDIDLKQRGIEKQMADFIRRHGCEDRVLIASFYDKRIRRFRKYSGDTAAVSVGRKTAAAFWAFSRMGCSLKISAAALQVPPLSGKLTVVDEKFIRAAHAAGLQVHVWTINEPEEMRRLLDLGVDGIITDRPDLLASGGQGLFLKKPPLDPAKTFDKDSE